ncbi:hypothetical protein EYC84_007583 [Monilinia fructicola]|uniref:Uncharacterized protein n=1 Tax=Monilinia fructicola TaxID=38448 RepID=A0A5M9JNH1_MONFR|nr:hypothetical protein EYC84_007583 [Monilinia fructicola]
MIFSPAKPFVLSYTILPFPVPIPIPSVQYRIVSYRPANPLRNPQTNLYPPRKRTRKSLQNPPATPNANSIHPIPIREPNQTAGIVLRNHKFDPRGMPLRK